MYHIFLNHSSTDGHLSCLEIMAFVNIAAMNMQVQIPFWDPDFNSWGLNPAVGYPDRTEVQYLISWGICMLFSSCLHQFTLLAVVFPFLHNPCQCLLSFVFSRRDCFLLVQLLYSSAKICLVSVFSFSWNFHFVHAFFSLSHWASLWCLFLSGKYVISLSSVSVHLFGSFV